jgi:hypothetical protein
VLEVLLVVVSVESTLVRNWDMKSSVGSVQEDPKVFLDWRRSLQSGLRFSAGPMKPFWPQVRPCSALGSLQGTLPALEIFSTGSPGNSSAQIGFGEIAVRSCQSIVRLFPNTLFFTPSALHLNIPSRILADTHSVTQAGVDRHAETARSAYTYADQQWRQEKSPVIHCFSWGQRPRPGNVREEYP